MNCDSCGRAQGDLRNRFGEPDAISPGIPLGEVEPCECGRPLCPECECECDRGCNTNEPWWIIVAGLVMLAGWIGFGCWLFYPLFAKR